MFELEKFFKGFVKGESKSKKKDNNKFLADSLKVSLAISIIIILIIYFIFRDDVDEDSNFFSLMFKAGLFSVIAITTGVYLHSKHLEYIYEDKYADKTVKDTVSRAVGPDEDDVMNIRKNDVLDTKKGGDASISGRDETSMMTNDKPMQVNVNISGSNLPKSGAFDPPKNN